MAQLQNIENFPYFLPPPPHFTPPRPNFPPPYNPPSPIQPPHPPPSHTPSPPPPPPSVKPPPPHTFPPPPPHPISPPPPHPISPPPPHPISPPRPHPISPPPPHPISPPPPHPISPPPPLPPHPIAPPPPHVVPTPPPPPHHSTVIIFVFVSIGGVFFLAFLAAALFCFTKNKKKTIILETDKVRIDKHVQVHEDIVPGPHGTQTVVLTIDEDVHIEEETNNTEVESETSHLRSNKINSQAPEIGGSTSIFNHHHDHDRQE